MSSVNRLLLKSDHLLLRGGGFLLKRTLLLTCDSLTLLQLSGDLLLLECRFVLLRESFLLGWAGREDGGQW